MATTISKARVFLNEQETLRIQPTMAFTVEPRMAAPDRPLVSFHLIVTFDKGIKRICADFAPVLEKYGMNDYLDTGVLHELATTR